MSIKIRKKVVLLEGDVTGQPGKKAVDGVKINIDSVLNRDITKLWDGIMKRVESAMPKNLYKHGIDKMFPNIALINEIEVVDKETGEKTTVRPRQLSELTKYLIGKMVCDPQLSMFAKYFDKPLIFTFAIPTACTDGVRIAVNPLFIDKTLMKEMEETKGALNGYYIMYILMHEIYHCVYQHFRRAKLKKETSSNNPHIAELVNIAQDAEINRDLEYQFPEKFKGKTEAIGGVMDEHFTHEVWEDIFDAYYYGKVEPPERPNNQQGMGGGNPKLKNQQGQQNQNQQGQGGESGEQQDPLEGKSDEYKEGFKYALECIENGTLDPLNWDMRVRYKPGFNATSFITNYRTKGALGKKTLAAQTANLETNAQGAPASMDDMQSVFGDAVDDGSKTFGEEMESAWGTYDEGFTDAVKAVAQAINDLMNGQQNQQGGGGGNQSQIPIRIPDKYLPKQARQQLQQQMQQGQGQGQGQGQQGQQQNGQGSGNGQSDPAAGSEAMGNGAGHFKNPQGQQQDGQGGGGGQQGQDQQGDGQEQDGQGGGGQGDGQDQQNQQGQGQGQGQTYNPDDFEGGAETYGTNHFGGNDIISQEEMKQIAQEAGQQYDTDDLAADPIEKAKDFFDKMKNQMSQMGGKKAGSGNSLADLVDKITDLFKSEIDWRSKLKKFFNGVVESEIKHTYQKRRIGSPNALVHKSRYIKYNEETDLINDGIAQVFYLIDDSGSMYTGKKTASGEDYVFTKIFSEIIELEKKTKIHDSMLTYFSTTIVKERIRHWSGKDNKHKILKLIQRNNDISGGTDIVGCMGAVIKLGKPYYRKEEPQTLMIVITDGYDDVASAAKFEMKYKRKVIWLLINDNAEDRKQCRERLKAGGYSDDRILEIDTNSYKKDMK